MINKTVKNIEQALEGVESNMTFMFGGFGLSGIPENAISALAKKDIFEPYVTNKSKGLGLGLSISKSIILAHKGKLKFRNLSTKGCNFFFTLPVK